MYLIVVSANVFPMQILLPPKKGVNASGFLYFPSDVRYQSLYLSNRSGTNLLGSFHCTGL